MNDEEAKNISNSDQGSAEKMKNQGSFDEDPKKEQRKRILRQILKGFFSPIAYILLFFWIGFFESTFFLSMCVIYGYLGLSEDTHNKEGFKRWIKVCIIIPIVAPIVYLSFIFYALFYKSPRVIIRFIKMERIPDFKVEELHNWWETKLRKYGAAPKDYNTPIPRPNI